MQNAIDNSGVPISQQKLNAINQTLIAEQNKLNIEAMENGMSVDEHARASAALKRKAFGGKKRVTFNDEVDLLRVGAAHVNSMLALRSENICVFGIPSLPEVFGVPSLPKYLRSWDSITSPG
jgi:hypothetical protein